MEPAKIITIATLVLNLALFLPNLSAANPCDCDPSMSKCRGPIHQDHGYTRFADVERHCESVLSSAAELQADPHHGDNHNLMYQLSFMNGDWSQDAGGQTPLFPFHGSYADDPAVAGLEFEAVPLASFSLRHMDTAQRRGARTAFNASGILTLTIARNSSCSGSQWAIELCPSPEFELRTGIARLRVLFQGVYTETTSSGRGEDGGGGERVLCMVGDAVLPVRGSNSTDPWDWAKNRGGGSNLEPPPVVSDGNILLVLRYPKTPTLTTRAVHGEMRSTNAKSDGAYFDTVRMVSQLSGGYDSGYQFRPEDAELDVDPPPLHEGDAMAMEQGPLNRGASSSSCDTFYQSISSGPLMEVLPNWNCTGTNDFCSRLGPFVPSSSSRPATSAMEDTASTRSGIVVTGLQCKAMDRTIDDGAAASKVAAVFRYVPPWEHPPMAATRTGLSGMTLSAEGVWIPSTGRAHMLGCLGVGEEACHYRVTLAVQTTMSVTRRGILAGKITAMDGTSHPPLLFQQRAHGRSVGYVTPWGMSYMYTKVDRARELLRLRASGLPGFRDSFVAKLLLSYPSVAGADKDDDTAVTVSLSRLADELDIDYQGMVKPPFLPEWMEGSFFELQMLSTGTLIGRRYSPKIQRRSSMWIELLKRVHGVEKQLILNVSAEFTAYRICLGPIPVMSLEGVYSPEDGRMYLIGCRNVHAPRRVLPAIRDLEDGMDCSIEVTVEYPPTTARWLKINWPAKVIVASTRDDDDPLHFNRTELHMWLVRYRQMRLEEVIKMIMKGFLSAVALLVTIWAATRTSP